MIFPFSTQNENLANIGRKFIRNGYFKERLRKSKRCIELEMSFPLSAQNRNLGYRGRNSWKLAMYKTGIIYLEKIVLNIVSMIVGRLL